MQVPSNPDISYLLIKLFQIMQVLAGGIYMQVMAIMAYQNVREQSAFYSLVLSITPSMICCTAENVAKSYCQARIIALMAYN